MHSPATVEAARALHSIGMDSSWIARELEVSRRSVSRWCNGDRRHREYPRAIPPEPYAYLLGLYLGDGHIATAGHGSQYLTIACDAGYPRIVRLARDAISDVVPNASVWLVEHPVDRCVRVVSCSRWWPVLFPQAGPGRKHMRTIVLATWQREICRYQPRALVRGLIQSDGSRFVANQRVAGKTYSYVRYAFSNRSADIRGIFCDHLDLLGIGWTRPNQWLIAVDRRSEVAKLDAFVGPKR
jgi:hypothetical protein